MTDDGGVLGAGRVDLPQAVVPVPSTPWRHSETRRWQSALVTPHAPPGASDARQGGGVRPE
eukprot:2784566-Pyramimonas_sp.AAC.1